MEDHEGHKANYWRFAGMIGTSTAVMFVLMYFSTYAFEHVRRGIPA